MSSKLRIGVTLVDSNNKQPDDSHRHYVDISDPAVIEYLSAAPWGLSEEAISAGAEAARQRHQRVAFDRMTALVNQDAKHRALNARLRAQKSSSYWNIDSVSPKAAGPQHRPGARIEKLLDWVPASARTEVFGQTIADMREDCREALTAGGNWRYRWTWLCGVFSVFMAFVRWGVPKALSAMKLLKSLAEIWKLIR
jgi:hypothetical protein